jgi:hypothetical protein
MMDHHSQNALRALPPRPLTDDERLLLRGWNKAATRLSAFVSERATDDPAIYRRIVVSRRDTQQPLHLIHASTESAGWIMVAADGAGHFQRFPSLRAALDHLEPVAAPSHGPGPFVAGDSAQRPATPARARRAAIRVGIIVGWLCALAGMLVVSRWLGSGGSIEIGSRDAEAAAEQLVQDSVGDAGTQFRNVMAYRVGPPNERWVCGWFYTTNASGETIGARRFVVHVLLADHASSNGNSGIRTHLLTSETEVPSPSYAWENYCR